MYLAFTHSHCFIIDDDGSRNLITTIYVAVQYFGAVLSVLHALKSAVAAFVAMS